MTMEQPPTAPQPSLPLAPRAPQGLPGSRPVEPRSPLFRDRALRAYAANEDIGEVLRVVQPSVGTTVVASVLLLLAALVLAMLLRIDVTDDAAGALVSDPEPRAVSAQIAGIVATVHVRAGERVTAGDALVSLDSSELRAQLVSANHRVAQADAELAALNGAQLELHERGLALLAQRAKALQAKSSAGQRLLGAARRNTARFDALVKEHAASEVERDAAHGRLEQVVQGAADYRDQLAQVEFEQNEQARARELALHAANKERADAVNARDALQLLLLQTSVRAPQSGVVESLITRSGERVVAGEVVARVVSADAPVRAVVFVSETSRAFVAAGSEVRLEVVGLPAGEFGYLRGKVSRLSTFAASGAELQDLLGVVGESAPRVYRADVQLERDESFQRVASRLRSGAALRAKVRLRTRSPLALVYNAYEEL